MSPAELADKATVLGKPGGISCRYEYDRRRRCFAWRFFRTCGVLVKTVTVPNQVMAAAARLTKAK